jgi:hypothetical protein
VVEWKLAEAIDVGRLDGKQQEAVLCALLLDDFGERLPQQ